MPSLLHEVFIDLVRRAPSLAIDLLRDVLHFEVPEYDHVEIASEDLSELLPSERRVDSVLVFHKEKRPALVLALEVQLTRDPEKRYSWPMYATALRARYRVPTVLLVVNPRRGTS